MMSSSVLQFYYCQHCHGLFTSAQKAKQHASNCNGNEDNSPATCFACDRDLYIAFRHWCNQKRHPDQKPSLVPTGDEEVGFEDGGKFLQGSSFLSLECETGTFSPVRQSNRLKHIRADYESEMGQTFSVVGRALKKMEKQTHSDDAIGEKKPLVKGSTAQDGTVQHRKEIDQPSLVVKLERLDEDLVEALTNPEVSAVCIDSTRFSDIKEEEEAHPTVAVAAESTSQGKTETLFTSKEASDGGHDDTVSDNEITDLVKEEESVDAPAQLSGTENMENGDNYTPQPKKKKRGRKRRSENKAAAGGLGEGKGSASVKSSDVGTLQERKRELEMKYACYVISSEAASDSVTNIEIRPENSEFKEEKVDSEDVAVDPAIDTDTAKTSSIQTENAASDNLPVKKDSDVQGKATVCYACPYCVWKTKLVGHFHRHLKTRHPKDGTVTCDQCSFTTTDWKKFRLHMATHEKPFQCDYCGDKFGARKDLTRHMYKHTGRLQ